MTTTVTVSNITHRKLKMLKKREDVNSFGELIESLADEKLEVPSHDEMFGSMEVRDKGEIRDRQDRSDRYD